MSFSIIISKFSLKVLIGELSLRIMNYKREHSKLRVQSAQFMYNEEMWNDFKKSGNKLMVIKYLISRSCKALGLFVDNRLDVKRIKSLVNIEFVKVNQDQR